MSAKVLESNNYGKFQLTKFNRDVKKTRYLEASFKKHGWIDAYPLSVTRNGNGKLVINSGHHRFVIAVKLGIPIKYIECQDNLSLHEREITTTNWSLNDFLVSRVKYGEFAYLAVKEYSETTGIYLSGSISLLAGESAGSHNMVNKFKDGTYKLGNLSHSRIVGNIIILCRQSGYPHWNNKLFIQAVSKIAWAEGFGSEVLKEKIKTFVQFMEKKATMQDYVEMLDSIYNRQSRERIPLSFLAEEAARKRNAIKEKNK